MIGLTGTKILRFGKDTIFPSIEYNRIVNEAELFYGNPHHDPITICISEEGLDMSTYTAGSWGIGAYFTKEALHSHPHAFESAGSKSLILA